MIEAGGIFRRGVRSPESYAFTHKPEFVSSVPTRVIDGSGTPVAQAVSYMLCYSGYCTLRYDCGISPLFAGGRGTTGPLEQVAVLVFDDLQAAISLPSQVHRFEVPIEASRMTFPNACFEFVEAGTADLGTLSRFLLAILRPFRQIRW